MRLAFLGPPGTFGEEAALLHDPAASRLPFTSHAAVVAAVEAGAADEGVIPVENSVEGGVNETLDILIHETAVQFRRELVLPIVQCLLVQPGTAAAEVRVIYSHPQALGQCRRYIERRFADVRIEAALSTAGAVQELGKSEKAAAIATRRAAQLYGAEVLAAGIQDRPNNVTRFVVIGAHDAEPTGNDKTSLAVGMPHDRPGTLVAVLKEFADEGISLTRIESRPSKDQLGVYIFLLDLEGHRLDPAVVAVLDRVQARSNFFKVFGSYPRYVGRQ
ncbi:MAG: prephenate dehydratase [Dehalococcoidia bacterium]